MQVNPTSQEKLLKDLLSWEENEWLERVSSSRRSKKQKCSSLEHLGGWLSPWPGGWLTSRLPRHPNRPKVLSPASPLVVSAYTVLLFCLSYRLYDPVSLPWLSLLLSVVPTLLSFVLLHVSLVNYHIFSPTFPWCSSARPPPSLSPTFTCRRRPFSSLLGVSLFIYGLRCSSCIPQSLQRLARMQYALHCRREHCESFRQENYTRSDLYHSRSNSVSLGPHLRSWEVILSAYIGSGSSGAADVPVHDQVCCLPPSLPSLCRATAYSHSPLRMLGVCQSM